MKLWRKRLLYCTLINYALLILWYVIMMLPHEWIYKLSCGNLAVTAAEFDKINFIGIVVYKMAVILFNLVPCLVLYVVGDEKKP